MHFLRHSAALKRPAVRDAAQKIPAVRDDLSVKWTKQHEGAPLSNNDIIGDHALSIAMLVYQRSISLKSHPTPVIWTFPDVPFTMGG